MANAKWMLLITIRTCFPYWYIPVTFRNWTFLVKVKNWWLCCYCDELTVLLALIWEWAQTVCACTLFGWLGFVLFWFGLVWFGFFCFVCNSGWICTGKSSCVRVEASHTRGALRVSLGTGALQHLQHWHRQWHWEHPQQLCKWHQAEQCSQYTGGEGSHPEGPGQAGEIDPCEPNEVQ